MARLWWYNRPFSARRVYAWHSSYAMAKRKKVYAVCKGRRPAIYESYYGPGGAEEQVKGFSRPCFMGFATRDEAQNWLKLSHPVYHVKPRPSSLETAPQTTSSYSTTSDNQLSPDQQHRPQHAPTPSSAHLPPAEVIRAKRPRNGDSPETAADKRRRTEARSLDWTKDYIALDSDHDGHDDHDDLDNTQSAVAQLPPLCDEQQEVIKRAKSGRNIFFTGSAGCGKSTVLHTLRKELEDMGKQVHVMAPTGIVALAINGVTTHNFANWNPDHDKQSLDDLVSPRQDDTDTEEKVKKSRLKRLSQVDVMIVDEISMVEHNAFQRLDFLLKEAKGTRSPVASSEPFGGVQVIVTGDFFQLPPVQPFKHCYACGTEFEPGIPYNLKSWPRNCESCHRQFFPRDQYAFRSDAWKQCNFICIYLSKVHRQKDAHFVSLLQKCRAGTELDPADINLLSQSKPHHQRQKALKLFPRKDAVNKVNRQAFGEIDAPEVFYPCYDQFILNNHKHDPDGRYGQYYDDQSDDPYSGTLKQLRDHRWEPKLYLKQGMRVMLLHNLDIEGGLCNGSQGEVINFVRHDEDSRRFSVATKHNPEGAIFGAHAEQRAVVLETFIKICKADVDFPGWPRVRFDNGKERTIYPECSANEVGSADTKPYSLLCRAQVPLTAGYAISIHKSQGMTLDNVIVDLEMAFQQEQIYVAMSRARSLEGLEVKGLEKAQDRLLQGKERTDVVKEFYREHLGVTDL